MKHKTLHPTDAQHESENELLLQTFPDLNPEQLLSARETIEGLQRVYGGAWLDWVAILGAVVDLDVNSERVIYGN